MVSVSLTAVLQHEAYSTTSRTTLAEAYPVVVAAVDVPGHAKVSNLDQKAVADQAVAGCQISVHKVLRAQVHHARGNLSGNVQHLGKAQLPVGLQRLAVDQDHGVRAVGSGLERTSWSSLITGMDQSVL